MDTSVECIFLLNPIPNHCHVDVEFIDNLKRGFAVIVAFMYQKLLDLNEYVVKSVEVPHTSSSCK